MAAISDALIERLAQYSTTLGEDRKLMERSEGRLRMAVEVRLGEKVLLRSVVDWLRERMANQDDREPHTDGPPSKKARRIGKCACSTSHRITCDN